jgi:hypothetical protein
MKELDYGGMFLFTAGMVLFLIGLCWGGTAYPWVSAQVLCTLIIGILTLIALGFYGMFPHPILSVELSLMNPQRSTSKRNTPPSFHPASSNPSNTSPLSLVPQ